VYVNAPGPIEGSHYYGTGAKLPAPPGFSRRWFRDACRNERTRPTGAFKLPGRGGWAISVDDWGRWIRTWSVDTTTKSIPSVRDAADDLRRRGVIA